MAFSSLLLVAIFPWTLFAGGMERDQPGGILSEPGIHTSGAMSACDPDRVAETEIIGWSITRASGEYWWLIASLTPPRWIAYRISVESDGRPDWVAWGTHDGDRITLVGEGPYTPGRADYCRALFGGPQGGA